MQRNPRRSPSMCVASCALVCLSLSVQGASPKNPVPFLDETTSPKAVAPGSPSFTLKLTGGGFLSTSVVKWNETTLATTVVTSRQINAVVPAALVATAQSASVTVVNSPSGGSSNPVIVDVRRQFDVVLLPNYHLGTFTSTLAVATGDFNHDGKADMAFVSFTQVIIVLGKGDGTFQLPVAYPVTNGEFADSLVIGDFNGDGNPDMAIGTGGNLQGLVYILFGNGDGTFRSTGVSYSIGATNTALAVADVNGDGNLDLVAGYSEETFISVLLGNGDGTFRTRTDFPSGAGPQALVLADFNRDGIVDVATSNVIDNSMSVLLGRGDGSFEIFTTLKLQAVEGIAAGDFNHDGIVDLAIQNSFAVSVFLGKGDGTFRGAKDTQVTNSFTPTLILGDFDGDGNLDLVEGYGDFDVEVLRGNGDGTFQYGIFIPFNFTFFDSAPKLFAAADFNNDGYLDLASADIFLGGFSIFMQSTLVVPESTLGFGAVAVGSSSNPVSKEIVNVGGAPVALGALSLSGNGADDFTFQTTCGSSLPGYSSCKITVTFEPVAAGEMGAKLNIPNLTLGITQFLKLKGIGR